MAGEYGVACLLAYIPGERPDPKDERAVRNVGAAYAAVNVALVGISQSGAVAGLPDWRGGLASVVPLAGDPGALVAALPAAALPGIPPIWLADWLARTDDRAGGQHSRLPVQLVHGDPGLSNVLYADGRVTGVIDFEFAGMNVPVADLADALYMLVDDWSAPVERARAAQLCAGYRTVSRLTSEEAVAIPDRLRMRAAGTLVWRAGRLLAGFATAADVADRVAEAHRLEQWLSGHDGQLAELVLRHAA